MSKSQPNYAPNWDEPTASDELAELRAAIDEALERADVAAEEGAPAAEWDG
jgi:hypothetical protein